PSFPVPFYAPRAPAAKGKPSLRGWIVGPCCGSLSGNPAFAAAPNVSSPTTMPTIIVQVEDPGAPHARALIAQLDAYLMSRYPAESNHLLPVEALQQPHVTFLTAAVDGQVAGCGAFVRHGTEYAEIKRMFVAPAFRGCRVGRRLLEELES